MAVIEVAVLALLLGAKFYWQKDWLIITYFIISVIIAIFLYFLLSYAVSLFAFWSREAMGPRFLFEWFLEFASGAFFPLSILSSIFYAFLAFLPFSYLIYFPMSIYIGRVQDYHIIWEFLRSWAG
jgi:ABC-2 type transport system permease protein